MASIHNYQVPLLEEDMVALKERCGETAAKEALTAAVHHCLKCEDFVPPKKPGKK